MEFMHVLLQRPEWRCTKVALVNVPQGLEYAKAHYLPLFHALTSPSETFWAVGNGLNRIMLYVPGWPAKYCHDTHLAICAVTKQY
jgi:hypothetical protein